MRNEEGKKPGKTVSDIKGLFCFTDERLIMINAPNRVLLHLLHVHPHTHTLRGLQMVQPFESEKARKGGI